jgi:hypothetical protein
MRDQLVAKAATYTTNTDERPCRQRDSNQESSGRRKHGQCNRHCTVFCFSCCVIVCRFLEPQVHCKSLFSLVSDTEIRSIPAVQRTCVLQFLVTAFTLTRRRLKEPHSFHFVNSCLSSIDINLRTLCAVSGPVSN